jgi:hypothetical protein
MIALQDVPRRGAGEEESPGCRPSSMFRSGRGERIRPHGRADGRGAAGGGRGAAAGGGIGYDR